MNNRSARRVAALFLIAFYSGQSASGLLDSNNDTLQIHGFLTQGYVNTTENNFYGESTDGSFDFREIGINASYRPHPRLMASAQLLSRKAGDMYDGSLRLDYAQLDFTAFTDGVNRHGLIVGRYKNPFGFYNTTRDVASTRPSIFLPQVIYWDRVRNMVLSSDGALAYSYIEFDDHFFDLRFFGGRLPIDENVEKTYLPPSTDPELDHKGLAWGGRALYEWSGGLVRLALSGAKLTLEGRMNDFPFPPPTGSTQSGNVDIDYWVASAQYNPGALSLTAEYMQEPLEFRGFSGFLDAYNTTIEGYYLQASYRIYSDWEILARYESADFDKDHPERSDSNRNNFVRMWTTGIMWEPFSRVQIRAEYSVVDGAIFLSNLENDPSTTSRRWNMFALQATYSF